MKFFILIFSVLSMYVNYANAASFDCTKAKKDTEIMICKYPEIGEADVKMSAAYSSTIKHLQQFQKEIKKSQLHWLKLFESNYASQKLVGDEQKNKTWVLDYINDRTSKLNSIYNFGTIEVVSSNEEEKTLCNNNLKKENITWSFEDGYDNYSLSLKQEGDVYSYMDRITSEVKLFNADIFGDGNKAKLIMVDIYGGHFDAHYSVLVDEAEYAELKSRFLDDKNRIDWYQSIILDLTDFEYKINKNNSSYSSPKVDNSKKKYKSIFVDASSTYDYQNTYTDTYPVIISGKIYFLTKLVNNLGAAPSITIFKLKRTGELSPLCKYYGPKSTLDL